MKPQAHQPARACLRRSGIVGQSGQSMVEYILLTGVIVIGVGILFALLKAREFFFNKITKPIFAYIKYSYKYGDKDALGWDEGGTPRKHIQISQPNEGQNFRLFLPVDR